MNKILTDKINRNIINIISTYLVDENIIKINKLKMIKHIDKYTEYINNQNSLIHVYDTFKQYLDSHPQKIEKSHFWNERVKEWKMKFKSIFLKLLDLPFNH